MHRQTAPKLRAPWSSRGWCAYFQRNARSLLPLPWSSGASLTAAEKAAVAASLQEFQRGESSEGRNLMRRAADYAARAGDPFYPAAMELFIREEQRHARDLGRFLESAGIPLLQSTRLDRVFRWLRRLAGLELMLTVLLIAETIGMVYYQAIRRATGSRLLRRLCEQLLRDEVHHLRFHTERLAILRRHRVRWRQRLARLGHATLFRGACLVVWLKHRAALRSGGFGFVLYWRACRREMRKVAAMMQPHNYVIAVETPRAAAA